MKYNFKNIRILSNAQKDYIVKIWNQEYSEQLAYDSITSFEQWIEKVEDVNHLIVGDTQGNIIGWAADFFRDQERWFSVLIARTAQGKGLGTLILDQLKSTNSVLNGWAVDHSNDVRSDGSPYPSPIGFYKKNGFKILDDRFEEKQLSAVKIRWTL
jgi:GNAT superfamily N-acetyltransferase